MNLPEYTLEDFLQDLSFRNWVHQTNPRDEQKWNRLLAAFPQKRELADRAALLLTGVAFVPAPIPESQITESWQRLRHRLAFQQASKSTASLKDNLTYGLLHWPRWAAAVVLIGLCSGLLYYFIRPGQEQIYRTNFGETATLILPDSSTVVLNGNTMLRYRAHWQPGKPREVWLAGEAFFSVLKKPGSGNVPFLVHTPDVQVKVLGTRFNVTNRRQKTTVVLNSGKVSLAAAEPEKKATATLVPGEMAELEPTRQAFRKRRVNPELYSAWTHKKLIFQATPLSSIVALLEDNYGFRVQVTNPEMLKRRLTGQIYLDDVNTLLLALSTSFNLKLELNGQNLRLAPGALTEIKP